MCPDHKFPPCRRPFTSKFKLSSVFFKVVWTEERGGGSWVEVGKEGGGMGTSVIVSMIKIKGKKKKKKSCPGNSSVNSSTRGPCRR